MGLWHLRFVLFPKSFLVHLSQTLLWAADMPGAKQALRCSHRYQDQSTTNAVNSFSLLEFVFNELFSESVWITAHCGGSFSHYKQSLAEFRVQTAVLCESLFVFMKTVWHTDLYNNNRLLFCRCCRWSCQLLHEESRNYWYTSNLSHLHTFYFYLQSQCFPVI